MLITSALGIDVFDPFSIVYGIMFVVIAFRIANFFELYIAKVYKINVRFNRFLLIIFNVIYVNYKINDLPNIVRKEEYLDVTNDGFCLFKCSKCGFQKRLPSKYFGKTAKCPKCNESNQIS